LSFAQQHRVTIAELAFSPLGAMTKLTFACLAALIAIASAASPVRTAEAATALADAGPKFRADGLNADAYGKAESYPSCKGLEYIGEQRCRVGALSHYDTLFPARTVTAPRQHSALRRPATEPVIGYTFAGKYWTLDQYLERYPVTGFLIAKDDTILVERYQYGRTDADRLISFSMAKTLIGLLIGIALDEGAIRSVDDPADTYVPGLKATAYGRTPIKALLQMRSGVSFKEDYADSTSDIYLLAHATLEQQEPHGSLAAVKRFEKRDAAPGERFSYSSADTVVLGLVLTGATRRTIADYTDEKLWQPLGTEADASWNIDAAGQEVTFAYFNAVLRDWARLGLMIAHQGTWNGKTIVPARWLTQCLDDAVDTGSPQLKYGCQVWVSADRKRYVLVGLRGQRVLIDPASKLVLVQTALDSNDFAESELIALWTAARAQFR
jgi:CubicO group peptidase (beta-lactamase class C family)